MSDSNVLVDRIEAEFAAASQRITDLKSKQVHEYEGRHQRLEQFSQLLEKLSSIWRPKLKALAEKFGERVDVKPHVEPGRRSATFEYKSELARIKMHFRVSPDMEVRNVVFTYDLEILPILMKFDSHDEIVFPLDAVDEAALGKWMDDRIVSFVKTYLSLHENDYYLKDHMVEDPIANVRFPKYAAGAKLDVGGKTLYFLDEKTLAEYQQKQG